jgi:hypothetical protein
MVIDVDDADQALGFVDHRGGDQVVALEHARHLLLVGGGKNAPPVRVHQFGDVNRALGAQQAVEPHRAEQLLGVVYDVKLEKPVRQVGGLAHVVDRVADRPVGRHRDELRLHAAAGGVLRIVQDLLDRAALGLRHLLEDLGLLILGQRLDDLRGIVGIEIADAFGDRLRRQFLEDLLADRFLDLGQRREVELTAQELDEARPKLGVERLDQVAGVGLVQVAREQPQRAGVAVPDRFADRFEKFGTDRTVLVAQVCRGVGRAPVLLVEHGVHAAPGAMRQRFVRLYAARLYLAITTEQFRERRALRSRPASGSSARAQATRQRAT